MMGRATSDLDTPINKTCGGLVVLPKSHPLILRKTETEAQYKRVGKSACDQCSNCTELCPRYLLGYPVKPHLVMRGLGFSGSESKSLSRWAQLCCECNICSLYACPEVLNPQAVCISVKREITANGIRWSRDELMNLLSPTHGMREYRQVSTEMLKRRLGLMPWDQPAPFSNESPIVDQVYVSLKQHTGVLASPVVSLGDKVMVGDIIATVADDELGAFVHASLDGEVIEVGDHVTIKGEL